MFRRFLPLVGLAALFLAGCGGSGTSGVSAGLGAKSLAAIKPPAFIPGPLDGQSTPRKQALRRPVAVIVENYAPDSRPQSGLGAASTVFETLAEGGVTRFMAVYLEHDAAKVGPVRSTRMYFDYWAGALHSVLTHVGGNDDAQALLWHMPSVFNIDENKWEVSLFDTGTPLFWRSTDRVAPHNMYTSTKKLRAYALKNHQNWSYARAFWPHKQEAPLARRGHGGTLNVTFENPLYPANIPDYDVSYVYDRKSNTYRRSMGGQPHVDTDTNKQLSPANVVVMHTNAATADPYAGITPQSILIPVTGSGKATFFRDGKVLQGTWRQHDKFAPLHFFDHRGKPVAFNPGQTWIEVLPTSSHATWSFH